MKFYTIAASYEDLKRRIVEGELQCITTTIEICEDWRNKFRPTYNVYEVETKKIK